MSQWSGLQPNTRQSCNNWYKQGWTERNQTHQQMLRQGTAGLNYTSIDPSNQ